MNSIYSSAAILQSTLLCVLAVIILKIMINNETHIYKLMQQIEKSLQDVIIVHGKIKKVSKIGNSMAIFFNDGTIYKQPLISKETSIAVMDNK